MVKYSKKAQEKIGDVMREYKEGKLKSGKKGKGGKVKNRKQAVAIAISEARDSGAKVPTKKAAGKKTASSKPKGKKSSTKKTAKASSSKR